MEHNNLALSPQHSELEMWWPSRYGAGDQLGALNEITPAKTVSAARLVRRGITYDLGRTLHADVPRFEGRYWQSPLMQIGDRFYNGWRAEEIVEDWGTSKLGIETVPPIVTRGVLADIACYRGVERLAAGDVISVADLEGALRAQGVTIEPGDVLLLHTGWGAQQLFRVKSSKLIVTGGIQL